MAKLRWAAIGVLIALAGWLVTGCGGSRGATNKGTGTLYVKVAWPAIVGAEARGSDGRFIPQTATSVKFTLRNASTNATVTSVTVVRPAAGATLENVPAGTMRVVAQAYAAKNATGTLMASGVSEDFSLKDGDHVSVPTVTLGTTIAKVAVTASASSVSVGQTATLTASASDADGNLVLVAPSVWQWTSSSPNVATVKASGTDATATATAVAAGSTTFTATDAEDSAKSLSGAAKLVVNNPVAAARILWQRSEGSSVSVHSAALDGSGAVQLSDNGNRPQVSGDGSKAVWVNAPNSSAGQIYVAAVDGTLKTAVTSASSAVQFPGICEDGHRVVWIDKVDGQANVYTAPLSWTSQGVTVGQAVNVSQATSGAVTSATISGDGETVAWCANASGGYRIYSAAAAGGAATEVSGSEIGVDGSPRLSHDGRVAVWVRTANGVRVVMSATVGATPVKVSGDASVTDTPSVCADGSRVVWQGWVQSSNAYQIFAADIDGSNAANISANTKNCGYPCISPDGGYVVWSQATDGDARATTPQCLVVARIDGSQQVTVTSGSVNDILPSLSTVVGY